MQPQFPGCSAGWGVLLLAGRHPSASSSGRLLVSVFGDKNDVALGSVVFVFLLYGQETNRTPLLLKKCPFQFVEMSRS
jgi:hypothetical protein